MAREKDPRRDSKGQIKLDWEEIDKLLAFQCTAEEIAQWFRCSVDTIERAIDREHGCKLAEYFNQKRTAGRVSLRRAQMQHALKGNTALLIFLGKNYLGQTDKQLVTQTIEGNITSNLNLKSLTTEELVTLNTLLKKADQPT